MQHPIMLTGSPAAVSLLSLCGLFISLSLCGCPVLSNCAGCPCSEKLSNDADYADALPGRSIMGHERLPDSKLWEIFLPFKRRLAVLFEV